MKIVYATDTFWPRVNGVTVSIDTFQRELSAQGHEISILAPAYPGDEKADGDRRNKSIFRFPSFSLFFDKEDRLIYKRHRKDIEALLDRLQPDIIHVQTEFSLGILCLKYANKRNIPSVMTCHTFFERYIKYYLPYVPFGRFIARTLQKSKFNKADHIIAPSSQMKTVLLSYKVKTPVSVIPTGIPVSEFLLAKGEEAKAAKWLGENFPGLSGRKALLFVGRVGHEKNIDFLLPMLKKVRQVVPEAALALAGDGPYRTEYQALVKKEGLEEDVFFLGYVARPDMKYLYRSAALFTFPSKTETQGLVTAEAMLCGTPVVAIGAMGTLEVMNGDNGGYMVKDDVEEFSQRVIDLLTQPGLYEEKSKDALKHAQNWTMESTIEKMKSLYASLSPEK